MKQTLYHLDDYSDELVPCDCTLDGWAKWLAKPDSGWGRDTAAQDGETFACTVLDVTHHRAMPVGGDWAFSPPAPRSFTMAGVTHGFGLGWDADDLTYDLVMLKDSFGFHQVGNHPLPVAFITIREAKYVATFRDGAVTVALAEQKGAA